MREQLPTDSAIITFSNFKKICHVSGLGLKDFGGFAVKEDGLYLNLLDDDDILTDEESELLSWHPTGEYHEPALPLPCTLGTLRAFVAEAGLLGCINEFEVDKMLAEQFTFRGITGVTSLDHHAHEENQQELARRRKEGRYTLEEAALFIRDATGERADELLRKLMAAAGSGAMPVYEPGKQGKYRYGEGFASRVRHFYEEARWCDLNKWLAENEPLIIFSFPDPNTSVPVPAESQGQTAGTVNIGTHREAKRAEQAERTANRRAKVVALAQKAGEEQWARGERQITARSVSTYVQTHLERDASTHGQRGPIGESTIRQYLGASKWKFYPPQGGPSGQS
jgi:hypothetical protein